MAEFQPGNTKEFIQAFPENTEGFGPHVLSVDLDALEVDNPLGEEREQTPEERTQLKRQTLLAIARTETYEEQDAEGNAISFNPLDAKNVGIDEKKDGLADNRQTFSVGRLQVTNSMVRDAISRGEATDILTEQEREVYLSGTFEEQLALAQTIPRKHDQIGQARFKELQEASPYQNPFLDAFRWQNPKQTFNAVKRLVPPEVLTQLSKGEGGDTGTASRVWSHLVGKYGENGAARIFLTERSMSAHAGFKSKAEELLKDFDTVLGADINSFTPYSRQMFQDIIGVAEPSATVKAEQTESETRTRQVIRDLDQTMKETEDPGILIQGLEMAGKILTFVGDNTRAMIAHASGLDVPVEKIEGGEVTAEDLIVGVLGQEASKDYLESGEIETFSPDKSFLENAVVLFKNHAEFKLRTSKAATEVGVDAITDPTFLLAGGIVGIGKRIYQGIKNIARMRGEAAMKVTQKEFSDALELSKKTDKAVSEITEPLKTSQQIALEKFDAKFQKSLDGSAKADPNAQVALTGDRLTQATKDAKTRIDARIAELETGKHRSIAQAEKEALEEFTREGIGRSINDARNLLPNAPVNDKTLALWAQGIGTLARNAKTLSAKYANLVDSGADPAEIAKAQSQALQLWEDTSHLAHSTESAASALGRGLRNVEESDVMQRFKGAKHQLERELLKNKANPETILRALASIDDPIQAVLSVRKFKGKDWFQLYRTGLAVELLSGPPTIALNIFSGFNSFTWGAGERFMAAGLRNRTNAKVGALQPDFSDALSFLWEGVKSVPEAAWALMKTSRHGLKAMDNLMASKDNKLTQELITNPFLINRREGAVGAERLIESAMRAAGHTAFMPISALLTTDRAMRHVLSKAEFGFQVNRLATEEGIEQGLKGTALRKFHKKRKAELMANPEASGPLFKKALQFSDDGIFTSRLKGAQASMEQLRSRSKVAQAMVPFFKAVMNEGNFTIRRMPGINRMLSQDFKLALKSNDPVKRKIAEGNLALGTTIASMGAVLAVNGNIIGRLSSDPEQRKLQKKLGIQPYSFPIKDDEGNVTRYVEYKTWGPLGTILGTMANITQAAGYVTEGQYTEAVGTVIGGFSGLMLDKTIARNVHEMLANVLEFGNSPEQLNKAQQQAIKTYTLTNPKALQFVQQILDPQIKDPTGYLETVLAETPIGSTMIPSEVDLNGDPIYHGFIDPHEENMLIRTASSFSRILGLNTKLDEKQQLAIRIMQPLRDLGITVQSLPRTIGTIKLSKEEMDVYNHLYYKGDPGIPELSKPFLLDLSETFVDWSDNRSLIPKATLIQARETANIDEEDLTNMLPNKVLQSKVTALTRSRKEAARAVLFSMFPELGDKVFIDAKIAESFGRRVNQIESSAGGRSVFDDPLQPEQDPVVENLEDAARTSDAVQFQLGVQ